ARRELRPALWSGRAILLVRSGDGSSAHFDALRLQSYHFDADGSVVTKEDIKALTKGGTGAQSERQRNNAAKVKVWFNELRKRGSAQYPAQAPLDKQHLGEWFPAFTPELAALISTLPSPVDYLHSVPLQHLKTFGHALNSETQLAVIRHYARNPKLSLQVRDHCKRWMTAALACKGKARWLHTDKIEHWEHLKLLNKSLLMTTVTEQVDQDEWAVLTVLCLLMPHSAPEDPTLGVVMPSTKAKLYWSSPPVRAAIECVLKTSSWTPVLGLVETKSAALARKY
ncbi:reverse transcriptase, partial [Globisporangium polare]